MEFSQEFLNKYKDNASMQDVIKHIDAYVENIKVPDSSYHEILFETMYGLKEYLKKENINVDMNIFYERLKKLEKIEIETYDKDAIARGYYQRSTNSISISDKYLTSEDKYDTLTHEIMHSVTFQTMRYRNFSHIIDEIYTENISAEICKILNKGTKETGFSIIYTENISAENSKILNEGTKETGSSIDSDFSLNNYFYRDDNCRGYSSINFYKNAVDFLYGKERVYQFYFNGYSTPFTNEEINQLRKLNSIMREIYKSDIRFDSDLIIDAEFKLQREFHTLILEKNKDDIGQYLLDYEKAKKFTLYNKDGNDTFKTLQEAFCIENIYCNIKNERNIAKELSPIMRSDDCKHFLKAIEEIQKTGKHFSNEELLNMSWEFNKENKTLTINISSDTITVNNYQNKQDSFFSLINENRLTHSIDRYITESNNKQLSPEEYEQYLISVITSESKGNHFKIVTNNCNFENIKDKNGNNLLHALALNPSKDTEKKLISLYNANPEAVNRMLNESNKGKTPIDLMYESGNIECLNAVFQMKMVNNSDKTLNNSYILTENGKYEPAIIIAAKENMPFVSDIIKNKRVDVNVQDSNGDTLLHLYAKGEIKNINLNNLLNAGADPTLRNNPDSKSSKGKTVIDLFIENNDTKALYTLVNNGLGIEEILKKYSNRIYKTDEDEKNYLKVLDKIMEKEPHLKEKFPDYFIDVYLSAEDKDTQVFQSLVNRGLDTEKVFKKTLEKIDERETIKYASADFYFKLIDKLLEKEPSLGNKYKNELLSAYCNLYPHLWESSKKNPIEDRIQSILVNKDELQVSANSINELTRYWNFDLVNKLMDSNVSIENGNVALIDCIEGYKSTLCLDIKDSYKQLCNRLIESGVHPDGFTKDKATTLASLPPEEADTFRWLNRPYKVPLIAAAKDKWNNLETQNNDLIEELLKKGANPFQDSKNEVSFATLALREDKIDWFKIMIRTGTSLEDIKENSLIYSSKELNEETIQKLEKYEEECKLAKLVDKIYDSEETPSQSSENQALDSIKEDPEKTNDDHDTPDLENTW